MAEVVFSSHMIHWEGIREKWEKYADVMVHFSGSSFIVFTLSFQMGSSCEANNRKSSFKTMQRKKKKIKIRAPL